MTTYTETHEFWGPKQLRGMHDHFEVKTSLISDYVMCVHVCERRREKEMGWRWGGITERKLAHFNMCLTFPWKIGSCHILGEKDGRG